MTYAIHFVNDWAIKGSRLLELQELLSASFPDFLADRTYYKQRPHGRLLAISQGKIVGQVGIDYRVVRLDTGPCSIFGVVDLCVMPGFRGGGIATALLSALIEQAKAGKIELVVALADDRRLYNKAGFRSCSVKGTWLGIEDRRTVGILERELSGEFLVKHINGKTNLPREIDFLGYLF